MSRSVDAWFAVRKSRRQFDDPVIHLYAITEDQAGLMKQLTEQIKSCLRSHPPPPLPPPHPPPPP